MRELSLFSGAGGGLLASKYMLGWETIGYVEFEEYPQKVLKQRIADGLLDAAPIFGDIRAFISEGYAEAYKGMVDVITGGFPCQPFSVAGKGLGEDDPRNMWPSTIECIRIVRPQFAFLENVPGLLTHKYIQRIFGDLAESGYDVRWRMLSAAEMGAAHLRDRFWILAHSIENNDNREKRNTKREIEGIAIGPVTQEIKYRRGRIVELSPTLDDCRHNTYAEGYRNLNGMAHKLDRFAAIGNGQFPHSMARAWEILAQ